MCAKLVSVVTGRFKIALMVTLEFPLCSFISFQISQAHRHQASCSGLYALSGADQPAEDDSQYI